MKKAFKITANNQYVQQVALPADIYTYQCNVLNPSDTYTFGLLTESGVWNYYEVEVTKDVWAHRAKIEFKTEEAVTAFSLCSANASVANPVYVQNPILAERAEFSGIATKSLEEYVSELESGLVTENCTATLANGVLTISDATADKGKVTLSIIEESSVISTQVFFEKGLTPSQSAKLEAISKGMTVIDGGYIQSNLVELGNPEEALITAGLSGIDKDSTGIAPDGKMPAFWAGGTYEEATSSTAKSIIRHDGTSKFTDTEITGTVNANSGRIGVLTVDTSGQVKLEDPDTGSKRLSFIKSKIPLLADLLSTTNFGNSATAIGTSISIPTSGSSTSNLSGTLNVDKNGADISIAGGAVLNLEGSFGGTADSSVLMSLYLMRNGSKYRNLQSVMISKGTNIENSTVYAQTLTGMPSGNYTLMLEITKVGTGLVSGKGSVADIPMSWTFQQSGIRNFLFGLNGFLSYFSDRHIYFSEEDGFDLKGKTNMPGVLAKGRIMESGARDVSKAWGDKNSTSTITKPSGVGSYRVPVNCKNGDYDVNISPRTANRTFQAGITTATYFEVFFRDHNGNAANSEFSYALVGNNY